MTAPEHFEGGKETPLGQKTEVSQNISDLHHPIPDDEKKQQTYIDILEKNDSLLKNNEIAQEILSGEKKHVFQQIIDHFEKDRNDYARQNFKGRTFDQLNAQEQEECFVRYFKEKTKEVIADIQKEKIDLNRKVKKRAILEGSPHAQKRIPRQPSGNQDISAQPSLSGTATGMDRQPSTNKSQGKEKEELVPSPEVEEKLQKTFGTCEMDTVIDQIDQTKNSKEKEKKIKQLSDILEKPYEEIRTTFSAAEAQQKKVDKEAQLTTAVVDHLSNKQVMAIAQAKTEEERKTAFAQAYVENVENNPELKDMACDLVLLTEEANSPEYTAFNKIMTEEYVEDRFDLAEKGDFSSFSYFPDGSFSYVQTAPENYDNNYFVFVKNGSMTIKMIGEEKNPEAYTRKLDYIPSKEEYQDTLDDLESVKIFDDFKFPQMFLIQDTARDRDMFVRGMLGGATEDKAKDLHRLSDDVTTIDHRLRILTGLKRSDPLFHLSRGPGEAESDISNRLAELGIWNTGGKPIINIDRLLSITAQIKIHPELFTSDPVPPEDWTFEKAKNFFAGGNKDETEPSYS